MKKYFILVICSIIVFQSCKKNKNDSTVNFADIENIEVQNKSDSKPSSEDKIFPDNLLFEKILDSFNKNISTSFPKIDFPEHNQPTSLKMEDTDSIYYNKFVGSYFLEKQLEYDFLSRNFYEIDIWENNGTVHYKFGKFENAITFDTDNSSFAEVSAGGFGKLKISQPITCKKIG